MSDTNQRLNKIITKALNTSPYSRATHDRYYKKDRCYTYATKPLDNGKLAYVETTTKGAAEQTRLVLVMSHGDDDLTMSTHHELAHIKQKQKAKENKINIGSSKLGVNEKIAKSLIWEAHARIIEVEGPLLGFFSDLLSGTTENIEFYKKHFSAKYTRDGAQIYMNALLGTQIRADEMSKGVDEVGYTFVNQFSRLEKDEKEAAMIRARKATVKHFFSKNGLENNETLDTYIGMAIDHHLKNTPQYGVLQEMEELTAYLTGKPASNERSQEILPLEKILLTTHGDYGPCLSEKDWFEAIGAKSNAELVGRNMVGSKYQNAYNRATKPSGNNRNGSYGYNFNN